MSEPTVTPEMIEAGVKAWRQTDAFTNPENAVHDIYLAMLAAAPKPIDEEGGGAEWQDRGPETFAGTTFETRAERAAQPIPIYEEGGDGNSHPK